MLRRSSYIVAAASVAAVAGPAAVLVCDEMVRREIGAGDGAGALSEREILMARAAAAAAGRKGKRGGAWRVPWVNWRAVVGGWGWRRARWAA